MHHLLHQVLQCMCSSGFKAQTDALVNSCSDFRNDTNLVTPTCKYRFDGRTRFFAACKYGNAYRVRLLLQCRANAGEDWAGNVPLVAAAAQGHADIVRLLLSAPNVDANAVDSGTKTNALYSASERGHEAVVRLLCGLTCRDRVDVHQQVTPNSEENKGPLSALHVACRKNHASIVRILLDAGADIDAVGDKDDGFTPETPLVSAVYGGAEAAIHELFRNGRRPRNNLSFLHLACDEGARIPALRALLLYCAGPAPFFNVNESGLYASPPLLYALCFWNVEAARLLLENPQVDIWAVDEDGQSAWSFAIGCLVDMSGISGASRLQVLRLLRDAVDTRPWPWADPQQRERVARFRPPCFDACYGAIHRKEFDAVRLMLQVDPALLNWTRNSIGNESNSLLVIAITEGELGFARELASMPGCDLNLCSWYDDDDGTALEECCWRAIEGEEGYLDMVKFLCGLPGISICTAGVGTDLPWRDFVRWAHYKCDYNLFMKVVQAVAEAYPNFSISNYTVQRKHPLVWACERAPCFEARGLRTWAAKHGTDKSYDTDASYDPDVSILSAEAAVDIDSYAWRFPLVRWLLTLPGINVNQIVPAISEGAPRFKCDAGWAEPRTILMFVMDITTTDCTLLDTVLQHPSIDLKQVCNGKTALQHWALRGQEERERIVRIAHESDCKAVLAFHASAEQLLQGNGAGSGSARLASASTGAGTSGNVQQCGKKKRKRGDKEQDQ